MPWEPIVRPAFHWEGAPCQAHRRTFAATFRENASLPKYQVDNPAETKAKEVCAGCPRKQACAEFGEREPWGVWGGVSGWERFLDRRLSGRHRLNNVALPVCTPVSALP